MLAKLTGGKAIEFDALQTALTRDGSIDAIVITGNYPSDWVTPQLLSALESKPRFVALIDTLHSALAERADVVIPGATWAEKAGCFENAGNRIQAFERTIEPIDYCKSEAQIAMDLAAHRTGDRPTAYDAAATRRAMSEALGVTEFADIAAHRRNRVHRIRHATGAAVRAISGARD